MYSKCVETADIKTNLRSKKPDPIRYLVSFSAFNFQYNKNDEILSGKHRFCYIFFIHDYRIKLS